MGIDTVICVVIAVVLMARLWSVLGRRNEEDKERPNLFVLPKFTKQDEDASSNTQESVRPNAALTAFKALGLAPTSLAGCLQHIKDQDPAFDEKQFLQQVRASFIKIVGCFAEGDLSPVTNIIGPDVLAQFQKAIEARKIAGQKMENKITAIKDVETHAVRIDGERAIITVQIISNQINVLRDAAGKVMGGEKNAVEEITDIWSFARDIKSTTSDWLLVETHA